MKNGQGEKIHLVPNGREKTKQVHAIFKDVARNVCFRQFCDFKSNIMFANISKNIESHTLQYNNIIIQSADLSKHKNHYFSIKIGANSRKPTMSLNSIQHNITPY